MFRIRMLMTAGLILLVALIANWIYTQYKEQKGELQKDLESTLIAAEQSISDSLILTNIINPIMQKGSFKIQTDINTKNGLNISSNTAVKFIIDERDSSVESDQLKQTLNQLKNADTNGAIHHAGRRSLTQITMNNGTPGAGEELLKPVIELVVKKLMQPGDIKHADFLNVDTGMLKKVFTGKMATNHWAGFTTVWSRKDMKDHGKKNKAIFLKSNLLDKSYNISISGYNGYLIKKITPQILFSVLLLFTIAAAFMLSYRTIKEQAMLAAIRNDLISNMSHELKTPISTVKVALEALDNYNRIDDKETTRDYLGMATKEMNRLDLLVSRALNAAMLEGGKMVIQKEAYDLKVLAEEVLEDMRLRFSQANATVKFNTGGGNFATGVDKLHLQGVLINLLDNSLKYSVTQPVIELSLREAETEFVLSVSDNGPGIPREYMKRVFDKFFRVPAGNSHNVKGYGLGLNYAKQIVELHGGRITVTNNETQGCMVTITIPKTTA